MERRNIGIVGIAPVCYARAAEQIDRIPDAVLGDEAIQQRRWNHRNSASEPALDAGDDRIGFDRKMGAILFRNDDLFHLRGE